MSFRILFAACPGGYPRLRTAAHRAARTLERPRARAESVDIRRALPFFNPDWFAPRQIAAHRKRRIEQIQRIGRFGRGFRFIHDVSLKKARACSTSSAI